MMVQGGKKPFVSAECNYSCNKAGALRVHMRTHSGEKPYSCKQREYSCTTVSDLKKHLLTHSGEKNHSVAIHAPIPAQQVVTSNSTWQHIQGRRISAVTSAIIHATMLVVWRNTCGSILGKNVCMQSVYLNLHNFKQSEDSYALTHRWEALCFQEMQLHVQCACSLFIWGGTWKSILLRWSCFPCVDECNTGIKQSS